MKPFDQLLKFADLLHEFRKIERMLLKKDSNHNENDAEHSFQLAMMAWYINQSYKLGLNQEKLFKYALAHDLVEVYAGDTYFNANQKVQDEKAKKEKEAAERIKKEFPELVELNESIENYEKREDEESKFIFALDKIEPAIAIYLDGGRTFKRDNLTIETIFSTKNEKVSINKTTKEIFDQLIQKLKENETKLFKK
jgi:putative hydrolase of HD superfamily